MGILLSVAIRVAWLSRNCARGRRATVATEASPRQRPQRRAKHEMLDVRRVGSDTGVGNVRRDVTSVSERNLARGSMDSKSVGDYGDAGTRICSMTNVVVGLCLCYAGGDDRGLAASWCNAARFSGVHRSSSSVGGWWTDQCRQRGRLIGPHHEAATLAPRGYARVPRGCRAVGQVSEQETERRVHYWCSVQPELP